MKGRHAQLNIIHRLPHAHTYASGGACSTLPTLLQSIQATQLALAWAVPANLVIQLELAPMQDRAAHVFQRALQSRPIHAPPLVIVLKFRAACLYAVRPMPCCVLFITIVDHGFKSCLGFHLIHQYDYECNSTGTDNYYSYSSILFWNGYFGLPGHAIHDGSHINNCKLEQAGVLVSCLSGGSRRSELPLHPKP